MTNADSPFDRLFVPLKTEHYQAFESGRKDVELRGYGDRFNDQTVVPGRVVELRRGYATDDSLWGYIRHIWMPYRLAVLPDQLDHERIAPGTTEDEFVAQAQDLLDGYSRYIAFAIGGLADTKNEVHA